MLTFSQESLNKVLWPLETFFLIGRYLLFQINKTRNNRGVAAYGQCVCFRVRVIGWVCRLAMRRCSCRYIYLCVFIYLYLRHILQVCYVICVSSFQVFICVTWCTCMCECTEYHVHTMLFICIYVIIYVQVFVLQVSIK